MANNPDWVILLETLYENERAKFQRERGSDYQVSKDHVLLGETGLEHSELEDAMEFLRNAGLVHMTSDFWEISEEGFQVAHQLKTQERRDKREDRRLEKQEEREDRRAKNQHGINRAVAFLTLGLIAVTVVDSAVRAFVGDGAILRAYYAVLAGAALLILFTIVLFASGLLSPLSLDSRTNQN